MKKLHRIINIIAWGILAAAFIHLCFKWGSMPEITGVHFDDEGEFDVYASKKYVAYPYIVGIVFLLLLQLGDIAARKAKLGLKTNAKGESIFRDEIRGLLGLNKLFISGMAAYWSELVIYQHSLTESAVMCGMLLLFVAFLTVCISAPILKIIFPQ